jgi:hypothetical protein
MAYYADMSTRCQIASGPFVRAVGWLGGGHDFPRGEPPPGLIDKLRRYARCWSDSVEALGWPVAGGCHDCELCGAFATSGNFGVPAGELLYVCPEMIPHYVEAHGYLPPPPFVEAVMAAPLPGSREYAEAAAAFVQRWSST